MAAAPERLSPHFTLAELTFSHTATRRGIRNVPSARQLEALRRTAAQLEGVRAALGGKPITVLSGFRSPALNAAVGGSPTSDHMSGFAVDIAVPDFGPPRDVVAAIRASGIAFDQLILELPDSPSGGWTHISFAPAGRQQALVYNGRSYKPLA